MHTCKAIVIFLVKAPAGKNTRARETTEDSISPPLESITIAFSIGRETIAKNFGKVLVIIRSTFFSVSNFSSF